MAMEQLLKIAERTEGMSDDMLAQVVGQGGGGIESLLAATEMKAREDIRQDAQQQNMQEQPPVIDQLLQRAAPQQQQMPQQMPQQMSQQVAQQPLPPVGMQPDMYQGDPAMAMLNQDASMPPEFAGANMGIAQARFGGLVRKFASSSGTVGGPYGVPQGYADALTQYYGYNPYELVDVQQDMYVDQMPMQVDQLQLLGKEYEDIMQKPFSREAQLAYQQFNQPQQPLLSGRGAKGFISPPPRKGTAQDAADAAVEAARQQAASKLFSGSQLQKGTIRKDLLDPNAPPGQTATAFIPQGMDVSSGVIPSNTRYTDLIERQMQQTNAKINQANAQAGKPPSGVVSTPTVTELARSEVFPVLFQDESKPLTDALTEQPTTPGFDLDSLSITKGIGRKIQAADTKRLEQLTAQEKASGDRLQGHLDRMKALEKDFPSRENIKKRLKEQTNYGVAAAFFNAAGSKSPDFLTALSQGFGGAAGVMQKMTGQEQKEMYKHAMDAYNREQQKANTQFKLDKNRSDEIYREKTLLQTTENNLNTLKLNYANKMDTERWKKIDMLHKLGKDAQETQKLNAEQINQARDDRRDAIKDWSKTVNDYDDMSKSMEILPKQAKLSLALETGYAELYVPGAQMAINQGLKDLVKDLSKVDKQLRTQANPILDDMQRSAEAFRVLDQQYRDEPKEMIGSRQLMRKFGPELAEIANSQNPNLALKQLIKRYPYLDPETFTEALSL